MNVETGKYRIIAMMLVLVFTGAVHALEPARPSDQMGDIRLSAIIMGNSGNIMVGLVNTAENWNVFRKVGTSYGDIEIVSANYEEESAVLKQGDQTFTLQLKGDENMQKVFFNGVVDDDPSTWPPGFKGPGIEKFLAENPHAVVKLPFAPKPPTEPVVVEGFGPGIEAALKEHPEWAEKARQPAVGKGEGIENFLRQQREQEAALQKQIEEGSPAQ
ncbi:MAG: hypothetical protein EOM20_04830 [Spartobacteria bacterium]|nr:hypothetical protein [Spartobacteria bacterium]